MSRTLYSLALVAALAPLANAQQPMPRSGAGMPGPMGPIPMMGARPGAASMLLSHTADLKLTDAQVTRLAAIARRTADRHAANRGAFDSLRAQFRPNPQAGTPSQPPAGPPAAARTLMERMRTQEHEDLRDAIAVLNTDQQATAWETVMRQHAGAGMRDARMNGMRSRMMRGRMSGPGMGARGMRPDAGPQGGIRMRQPAPAPGDSSMRRPPRRPE